MYFIMQNSHQLWFPLESSQKPEFTKNGVIDNSH